MHAEEERCVAGEGGGEEQQKTIRVDEAVLKQYRPHILTLGILPRSSPPPRLKSLSLRRMQHRAACTPRRPWKRSKFASIHLQWGGFQAWQFRPCRSPCLYSGSWCNAPRRRRCMDRQSNQRRKVYRWTLPRTTTRCWRTGRWKGLGQRLRWGTQVTPRRCHARSHDK